MTATGKISLNGIINDRLNQVRKETFVCSNLLVPICKNSTGLFQIYIYIIICTVNTQHLQGAAERTPLFGKLIKSKPKKIRIIFYFISGKYTKCRFTSTCFEKKITQLAALNIDRLI